MLVLSAAASLMLLAAVSTPNAFAESSQFTIVASDSIKNNPAAMEILEKIEIMKQKFAEMKQKEKERNERQKFLDEQRKIAENKMKEKLEALRKQYESNTPKAAFEKFVSNKPAKTHDVYWGMFDYQTSKVEEARKAMQEVLDKGGTYEEAREAYNKIAAIKRVTLIEITKNLNLQYGLADDETQKTFDIYGKLPRYED